MSIDRLYQLAAQADEHLNQFRFDATEEDMQPKKKRPMFGPMSAVAAGVGGTLAYQNSDKIKAAGMAAADKAKAGFGQARTAATDAAGKVKDGFGQARTAATDAAGKVKSAATNVAGKATEAGKDVAWTASRKTAEGLNSAGNFVGRAGKKIAGKSAMVDNAVGGLKGVLKKGAKSLRKSSMKFWSRGQCDRIVELAERIEALEFGVFPEDYYSRYPLVNEKYRGDRLKKKAIGLGGAAVGAVAAKTAYDNRKLIKDTVTSGVSSANKAGKAALAGGKKAVARLLRA